jgi:parvulin-like peptidyl-prolyl isomerase
MSRAASRWLILAGLGLTLGCGETTSEWAPVARYRDWRDDGHTALVRADTLLGWRDSHPRRPRERQGLREEIEELLVVQRLADEFEDEVPEPLAHRLERAETAELLKAYRKHLASEISVHEERVEELLAKRPDAFHRPSKVRLRNLLLRVATDAPGEERDAVRARVDAIRAQVEAGADFAALAERESESETRSRGGLIGFVDPRSLSPQLGRAAAALEAGSVSPVLEIPDGFLLLYCDAVQDATAPAPDEQRARIETRLERLAVREGWEAERARLVAEAAPEFFLDASEDDDVVLRIAARAWTRGELRTSDVGAGRAPSRAALERLVVQHMAASRARELGLDREPAVQTALAWRRSDLLAADVLARQVSEAVEPVRPEEVGEHYRSQPERYQTPEQLLLRVIRLPRTAATARTVRERAEALVAGLRSGALEFEGVARRESEHPSADRGGSLGWRTRNQVGALGPEFSRAAVALGEGQISDPVPQANASWILLLEGRQAPEPLALEQVAEAIEREIGRRRARALGDAIRRELSGELEVTLLPGAEAFAWDAPDGTGGEPAPPD